MAKRFGKLHRMAQSAELSTRKDGLDFPDGGRVFFDRIKRVKGERVIAEFLRGYAVGGWNAWSTGGEMKALVANTNYKPSPYDKLLMAWTDAIETGPEADDAWPVLHSYATSKGYTIHKEFVFTN